jgi:hypothetical protein
LRLGLFSDVGPLLLSSLGHSLKAQLSDSVCTEIIHVLSYLRATFIKLHDANETWDLLRSLVSRIQVLLIWEV